MTINPSENKIENLEIQIQDLQVNPKIESIQGEDNITPLSFKNLIQPIEIEEVSFEEFLKNPQILYEDF
ncbi:MAG: hypothetical protein NZZ41_06795 [Candidatus Dojkabacteria bacterium]|nr:hypothetical protein [Candidatus Dojkabacteria bacterium]